MTKQKLLDEIDKLPEEFGKEGWNGYGAPPVSPLSIEYAKLFIGFISDERYFPDEISVDPYGDVNFEWYKDYENFITFSFYWNELPDWYDKDYMYGCFCININKKIKCGTKSFKTEIPQSVLEYIEIIRGIPYSERKVK